MKNKTKKKILSAILAASLSMGLIGCGAADEEKKEETSGVFDEPAAASSVSDNITSDQNAGMGRYVEQIVYETDAMYTMAASRQGDGSLLFVDCTLGRKYLSYDQGNVWEIVEDEALSSYVEEHYATNAAVSDDGSIAMINMEARKGTEDSENLQYDFVCNLYNNDGTVTEISADLPDENKGYKGAAFGEDGTLYVSAYNCDTIYAVNAGETVGKALVDIPDGVEIMQCRGNILMCVTYDKTYFYDLKNKNFIEDEVFNDFIKDNYENIQWFGSGYTAYLFMGEENVVYVAGEKGLHRHVIGGSVIEQVIDGSLSSFGDPSHSIMTALMNDEQEFLAVFNDGRFIKYTFDDSVPAMPEGKLTVYSLREDDVVKQAISAYQTANPDMYIEYETGMAEGSVTREDALKKLNTELLSGNGPDVLILDDMNIDTYMEKGALMDLSDIVTEIDTEEGLFMNLIEPFCQNSQIYIVPADFAIPYIAGHEDTINSVEDYQTLAAMVEKAREEYPDKNLLGICSASGIIRRMLPVCEPSWKDKNGQADEEKIKEFLQITKRIYDAQMNGTPKQDIEMYLQTDKLQDYESESFFMMIMQENYYIGSSPFAWGELMGYYNYIDIASSSKIKGCEDTVYKTVNGQSSNVYHPSTLTGINAATDSPEQAKQFVKLLLSSEVQDIYHNAFPINRKSFVKQFAYDENQIDENGGLYSVSFSNGDGLRFGYTIYPASQEDISALEKEVVALNTPYIQDSVIESAVITEGERYFEGDQDLDTAVGKIMESIALYTME